MGYQLKKHDPYVITGKNGKEYQVPAPIDMNIEEIGIMLRYNKSTDELEKAQLCKDFFLHYCPDLEEEGISDMEYFMIFQDYNKSKTDEAKEELGE